MLSSTYCDQIWSKMSTLSDAYCSYVFCSLDRIFRFIFVRRHYEFKSTSFQIHFCGGATLEQHSDSKTSSGQRLQSFANS
jgi:hypothetical protein